MRAPITEDAVDELEFSTPDHRRVAEQLAEWGDTPHPQDELSPRELLTAAGEQLELAGDPEAAEAVYRRAARAEGFSELDPRSHLMALRLERGDTEEALALDTELRRSRPADAATYEYMADVWADHGDDRRALGWASRGIRVHDEGARFSDTDFAMLCLMRWRIRERAGQEPDEYDLVGIGMDERLDRSVEKHPPLG